MKPYKLKNGGDIITVNTISPDTMEGLCENIGFKNPETYLGLYLSADRSIWLRKDTDYSTLIHEIVEYISSEYGLEMNHEQLSVLTKVLANIQMENKGKFRELLK